MAIQVSDFLLQRLSAWGIKRIYGYPGDGINASLEALSATRSCLNSSKCVMKRWPHLWRLLTPNLLMKLVSV
jgi:hypothetical protein